MGRGVLDCLSGHWVMGQVVGHIATYKRPVSLAVSVSSLRPPSCGHSVKSEDCDKESRSEKMEGGLPDDPKDLHELSLDEYSNSGKFRIDHTPSLKLLDKAAIKSGLSSSWSLCSVTQVEETKQMLKMLLILAATFIPSTMLAQTHTLHQARHRIEQEHGIVIYDRFFVPAIRQYTNNPRGITLLQRMGIGLVLHVIIMLIACFAERKRLGVAKENGIFGKKEIVPLSIFNLLPQFALMGVADNFLEVAKLEFFYDQAPEGMKSLGTAYFTTSFGVGYFLSSFLLSTVADITKKNGHRGWLLDNLYLSFRLLLCFLCCPEFYQLSLLYSCSKVLCL
ncbi:unnamed protein product [Ilex paraguariensis]|uniref:Uncharacterized protein n=1 Tax=Ilex paraguariensis TaxID=185542 RepID=A0ABC8RZH9_9AQUA